MAQQPHWTTEEFRTFDSLIDSQESRDQMVRIEGRLNMRAFVAEHGRLKCDAMFAHLEGGGERLASAAAPGPNSGILHQDRPS